MMELVYRIWNETEIKNKLVRIWKIVKDFFWNLNGGMKLVRS